MSEEDFEGLKKFLGFFYEWFEAKPHHPPEIHPLVVLAELERKSPSKARRGLGMAVNDCVEVSSHWSPELVSEADKRLLFNGAPSLSQVRAKYSKNYLQVLKRGNIKSLNEYYLVKGILEGGGIEPGASEAEKLATLLVDYESRLPSGSKR